MITIESTSGRILYAKNEHKKRPMASVTKILTAITVLENTADLDVKRIIPAGAAGIEGSSIYLAAGEKISTIDLLYGLMLQSGNDCAVALAILTGGSIDAFATLMNKTAQKAGANSSNFINPHGLHDERHYTTAFDLAYITAYAMRNKVFRIITAANSRRIERTREDAPTLILNKNKLLNSLAGADGVKTGFTKKAGRCLVASATREGMQIISVVLNCGPMFEECSALINAAFGEYKLTKIAAAGDALTEIKVFDGKSKTVKAGIARDLYYPLRADERVEAVFDAQKVRAPFKKGRKLGKVEFYLENRLIFSEELFSIEDAGSMSYWEFLKRGLGEWRIVHNKDKHYANKQILSLLRDCQPSKLRTACA